MSHSQVAQSQSKTLNSPGRVLQKLKEYVFRNCYKLISSLNISLPLSILLLSIDELQKFAIISRLGSNPNISLSPEMAYVDLGSRYLLLDLTSPGGAGRSTLSILLCVAQVIITLCYLVPIESQGLRQVLSKTAVTAFQYVLVTPCLLIGADCLSQGVDCYASVLLLLLSTANIAIYKSMQFECSFQKEVSNVLVRVPRPMTPQLVSTAMVILFPVLTNTMYPSSFPIYLLVNFGVILWQWWQFLKKFTYFQERLASLKGVLLSISISTHICYIAINVLANAIISQNVLLFISTFSIFLANFFVVFRNSIVKNTIINEDLKGEYQTAISAVFYWHCYKRIAIKKNQLYISSLLKKHMNECADLACCCKNRGSLYDANSKTFGNPKLQPHNDRIFIRHYIRRLIMKGCEEHSKSIMLLFLLIIYDIEAVEMITYAVELIKKLSRMEQKKKLNFSQKFLLFCVKQTIKEKIASMNLKRGNLELQNVKTFDQKLSTLQGQLRSSVKLYQSLWKHLNRLRLDQTGLYGVCKKALGVMFDMQRVYEELKRINKQSTELKGIMLFYARMVVHDIHLLSQIKKEIKASYSRSAILGSLQQINIKTFGPKTTTLLSLENGKIKWSSKNAHLIFEYPLDQFHGLTIKHLMPRYFADNHDAYVQSWKETGHHVTLNKTSYAWGNNKDGTIFSILMFVKLVPLLVEQDYAFFSCMEKLDDQNELVCTSWGEVIGAGKLFAHALAIDPKILQQVQPNIQVFMPYLFDYFLQYFYSKSTNLRNLKNNIEMRRQGYFPENLQQKMSQITYHRNLFKKNNRDKQNFQLKYLNFVRQKMQELTCNVSGNYISFLVKLYKTVQIFREKSSVLCLKVFNPKKDNVEKFYAELQKVINRLQKLTEEVSYKGYKTNNKKSKSDFFKTFLNPKKVRQIMQTIKPQQEEPEGNENASVRSESQGLKPMKSAENLIRHRQLLAIGAQVQIKNQRVKYNLWKIKKMLRQEGVISRYTYNLLIGKKDNASAIAQIKHDSFTKEQGLMKGQSLKKGQGSMKGQGSKAFNDPYEEQVASLQDKFSRRDDSEGSLADKQMDNQTFNSASSSATFISKTNQVKMLKAELRSLNSPRPLLVLNILIMVLVLGQAAGVIFEIKNTSNNISYGLLQFQLNTQANEMVGYLLEAQLSLKYNFSSLTQAAPLLKLKKQYLLSKIMAIFRNELQSRNIYKQISPQILDFIDYVVNDTGSLKMKQFFQYVIQQVVEDKFCFSFKYFVESMQIISNRFLVMSFTPKIQSQQKLIFISYLLLNLAFLLITLPIVYKIQLKIKQIYNLLGKISPNQKHKFYKHYRQLEDEFKRNPTLGHQQLAGLYQGKMKLLKCSQAISEQDQKSLADLAHSKKKEKEKQTLSTDKSIYLKIGAIYLVLFSSVIFYYLFNSSSVQSYKNSKVILTQIFNSKTVLTQKFAGCVYEMMGFHNKSYCQVSNMQLVDSIYNTFQLPNLSPSYANFVISFVNGTLCNNISQLLQYGDPSVASNLTQYCKSLIRGTFDIGAINSLYYCQRKIEYQYQIYNKSLGNGSSAMQPYSYLNSEQFFQISQAFFFNTFFMSQLFNMVQMEMSNQAQHLRTSVSIGAYVFLFLILLFSLLWIYIFTHLGQSASYINAFLLLIPFDVLSQNPYIKLYVKNEFDYKAASY